MSRFLPYGVNENEGLKGENGVESTKFGGKHDVNLYNNEDINAKESDDGIYKEYYYYDVSHDYDDDDDDDEEEDDSDDDDDETEDDRYDDDNDDDHDHDHDDDDDEENGEEDDDDVHAHDQDDIRISDCESSASVNKPNNADSIDIQPEIGVDRLIRLNENDILHVNIGNRLISAVEAFGVKIHIEQIDMNVFSGNPISETRLQTFLSYKRAVDAQTGGYVNVTHAWFVASKDQINHIILHGFSHESIHKKWWLWTWLLSIYRCFCH